MRRSAVICCVLFINAVAGQVSPFNGRPVPPPDSTGSYRLLFGGHFHGASTNRSGYPAATLLANIEAIDALGANALLSTGDLFLDPDGDSARYARSLFSRLQTPLFNAPGNHDLEGRSYQRSYGPTHRTISLGGDRMVLLDTERDNGDVVGDQLEVLKQLAVEFRGDRVFIVSHRPVWAEDHPAYGPLFKGNTRSVLGNNFKRDVEPILERIASKAAVYWISGSMAGGAPASIFFQPTEKGITYIQCAIRDEPRDALLIADVRNGEATWEGFSLTGRKLLPVETYDARWWQANKAGAGGERFNPRLIPLYVRNTVIDRRFWYGVLLALVLIIIGRRLLRRGW